MLSQMVSDAAAANNPHGAGDALKGLTEALESLQQNQRAKLLNKPKPECSNGNAVNVTVSLPPSRKASRQTSRAQSPEGRSSSCGSGMR